MSQPAAADNVYRFAGTTFPLIFEKDPDGRHHGLAVDILHRISDDTGMRFKTEHLPWARALAAARTGRVDALIGPYWSEERAQYLDYSTRHFYADRMVFVARNNTAIPWAGNFEILQGFDILAVRDWAYGPEFTQAKPKLALRIIPTFDQGLRMLIARRGDLLAANARNAQVRIAEQNLGQRLKILRPAFHNNQGYFGFPKVNADKALQKRFNAALEELWDSGAIHELSQRYGLWP